MNNRLLARYSFFSSLIGISLIFILGFVQSGYNQITQTISDLGALGSPYALIMNGVVFPIIGSSIIALGLGLHYGIKPGKSSFIGPLFLLISGFSIALIGVFPNDFVYLHSFAVSMAFLSMIAGQLTLYSRLNNDKKLKGYAIYTVITAVITAVLLTVFMLCATNLNEGLLQRVSMGASFIWLELVAFKLMTLK